MGNSLQLDSLVTSSVSSIGDEVPWSKQFTLLDKQPLNNTYILHHIPTNTSYKVKHMTLNKSQHQQIFRQIDTKKNTPSPFVTKLQKTQQYTVKGYCSQHEEVFLMYKYVETNLKEEILNRRFRQQKFLEEEIKVIMESGVKGISYLHGIGCTPKGLNTSEILLTQERAVLVNDPWLGVGSPLAYTNNQHNSSNLHKSKQVFSQQQERSKIYSIPIEDYPSPQKLLYMNQLIQEFDQWLSQLFTFGMIVLQTIFMTALNEQMYDKGKRKIYYHRVKQKIEEIEEGVQLQSSGSRQGQNMMLSEIKEDLRRLLSHQPKMRQTVYFKYKKTHNNNLLALTISQNNPLICDKNNNNNDKQKQHLIIANSIDILPNEQKNDPNNINSKYFNSISKTNNNNNGNNNNHNNNINNSNNNSNKDNNTKQQQTTIRRKQNWVLNSINQQHYEEWLKMNNQKQTQNNRFRVVSSSLPQRNNTKIASLQLGEMNPFKKKNDGLQLAYRQLGGMQSNNKNITMLEHSHGSFQSRQNNFLPRMSHLKENSVTINSQPIKTVYQNDVSFYKGYDYEKLDNTSNYKTVHNYNTVSPIYSGIQYSLQSQLHQLPSMNGLRTTELSPKKEVIDEKQTQKSNNFNFNNYSSNAYNTNSNTYNTNSNTYNNCNKLYSYPYKPSITTLSTIPSSSPYIASTISSNAYVSQISPTMGQDGYSGTYSNGYFNKYDSSSVLNTGNIFNNLPGHMVTRSSSSYVLQDKLLANNINSNYISNSINNNINNNNINSNNTNNNNINNNTPFNATPYHSNPSYPYPQQSTTVNKASTWTYDNMVNVNNNHKETPFIGKSYIESSNENLLDRQSSYQLFKQSFLNNNGNNTNTTNNNNNNIQSANQQQKSIPTSINQPTTAPTSSPPKPSTQMPKLPCYKQLNSLHFREVGSLYYQDSHFSNDKESIVIQSYSGGIGMGKYITGGLSSYKGQMVMNGFGGNSSYMRPTISPKESLQINHSIINNTRNDGKSFSSMDEDVRQLRKFGQQQQQQQYQFDKKPNSSYSSSQKVSVIDKIYDPQVMGGYQRRSFEQNGIMGKEDFGDVVRGNERYGRDSDDHQEEINNSIISGVNRCSEDVNTNRVEKRTHTRNSSQNYLQTPQRYPAKYKHNSTIRQASCEDSGVNLSNGGDSYDHQKIHPNTETSKYQTNEERRYSLRKVGGEEGNDSLIENNGFNTERGRQRDRDIRVDENNCDDKIQQNQTHQQQRQITQTSNKTHTLIAGQRVTLYADGSRYVGSTDQNSQSHGHGILYYPDGHIAYEGQWQHGDFHGNGHLFNPYELAMQKSFDYRDLTKMDEYIKEFQGIFNRDVKEGKGVLKMHNNEVYQGEFSNDLPHGRGKFYCSDGNVVEGVWEKGFLQQTY